MLRVIKIVGIKKAMTKSMT
jgi:2-oxoisovalerate dehydrogenase E2 component (dihydrolipoyl transacylase)